MQIVPVPSSFVPRRARRRRHLIALIDLGFVAVLGATVVGLLLFGLS